MGIISHLTFGVNVFQFFMSCDVKTRHFRGGALCLEQACLSATNPNKSDLNAQSLDRRAKGRKPEVTQASGDVAVLSVNGLQNTSIYTVLRASLWLFKFNSIEFITAENMPGSQVYGWYESCFRCCWKQVVEAGLNSTIQQLQSLTMHGSE